MTKKTEVIPDDPMELAWAGGLFDGEGCWVDDKGTSYVGAQLSTTDYDTICRFNSAMGFGHVYERKRKTVTGKTVYTWNGRARFVFHILAPWLSERRRQRAMELLYA